MFTPEMSTCQTVLEHVPERRVERRGLRLRLHLPGRREADPGRVRQERPLRARPSPRPPPAPTGPSPRSACRPGLHPGAFTTSYARGEDRGRRRARARRCATRTLKYRINGADARAGARGLEGRRDLRRRGQPLLRRVPRRGRRGAGRLGRGVVHRRGQDGRKASSAFTYRVAARPAADVLVVAEEGGTPAAEDAAGDALAATDRKAIVWDVATQGAPDALGVLSTSARSSATPAPSALRQADPARRPRLPQRGRQADRRRREDRRARPGSAGPSPTTSASTTWAPTTGGLDPRARLHRLRRLRLADRARRRRRNPLDNAGPYSVTPPTQLTADKYPQFASAGSGRFATAVSPFEPYAGSSFAASCTPTTPTSGSPGPSTSPASPRRQARACALPGQLGHRARLRQPRRRGHTVGQDDWTTPSATAAPAPTAPAECGEGYYLAEHPWRSTTSPSARTAARRPAPAAPGTPSPAPSSGWRQASLRPERLRGQGVELSLAYVSDPGIGERGVLRRRRLARRRRRATETEGFETSLGAWSVPGPPGRQPRQRHRLGAPARPFQTYGAVTTDDTVLLGLAWSTSPRRPTAAALIESPGLTCDDTPDGTSQPCGDGS